MLENDSDRGGFARFWNAPTFRCPSHTVFALCVSLAWAFIYNIRFWQEVALISPPSVRTAAFMASLFVIVLLLQALILMLIPGRVALKTAASALFVVAALNARFANSYGAVVDSDMIRNVFETDTMEMGALIDATLLTYLFVLGVLPALLVWRVDLPAPRWRLQLSERISFLIASLVICATCAFSFSAAYASFLREHKPVRYLISPGSMVAGMISYLAKSSGKPLVQPLLDAGGPVKHQRPPFNRPLVVFLVVGETARAANFQLGGYARETNPRLSAASDLVYFDDASSCGTSTSISVPCIFSHLGRERFDNGGSHYLNLLDMLAQGGVDVEWRDNNAGCKGVCARVPFVEYAKSASPLCRNGYCFDEVLMSGLARRLDAVRRDSLIVFHQIGSHGPAYSERYPAGFERFRPVCLTSELDHCSSEEVVNAYDNTILYTDHNLAEQIQLLRSLSDRFDTLLMYVSDHGESLGEQRIYLHGMPYSFAPEVQTHVPLLIWTSAGFRQRTGLSESCLQAKARQAVSHDNVFHTVMGIFGLSNSVYRPQLDLLAACSKVPIR